MTGRFRRQTSADEEPRPTPLDVGVRHRPGLMEVIVLGELDMANVHRVREAVATREPGEDLVLDLGELRFTDTSRVAIVVEVWRASLNDGFALRLVRAAPEVHRIFEIAGLSDALPWTSGDHL